MKKILAIALVILTSLMLFSCSKVTMEKLEKKLKEENFEVTVEEDELELKYLLIYVEEQYNLEFDEDILVYLEADGAYEDSSGHYDCQFYAYEFESENDAKKMYDRLVKEVGKDFVKRDGTLVIRSTLDRALKFYA
jgi:hypothetical protein